MLAHLSETVTDSLIHYLDQTTAWLVWVKCYIPCVFLTNILLHDKRFERYRRKTNKLFPSAGPGFAVVLVIIWMQWVLLKTCSSPLRTGLLRAHVTQEWKTCLSLFRSCFMRPSIEPAVNLALPHWTEGYFGLETVLQDEDVSSLWEER